MTETPPATTLIEASFADAILRIEQASILSIQQRQHWACSLRQVAKWLDRPLDLVPARWTAVRVPLEMVDRARLGLTPKTVANHKAQAKAALRWLSGEEGLPSRGVPLDEQWARLRDAVRDKSLQARLSWLMRYASAKGIAPDAVTDQVLGAYLRYRGETTALPCNRAAARSIARSWNRCVQQVAAWPKEPLTVPELRRDADVLPWETVPESLRVEIDAYLASLARKRTSVSGKRWRPAKPSTIRTRRAEIQAFVRQAVRIGTPVESLTSLSRLLDPALVERVLESYVERDDGEPKTYTVELGWKLLSIARQTRCLDAAALAELDELRVGLEDCRQTGLTDKNLAVIRQVMTADVWGEVVRVPARLMQEARGLRDRAPIKAALRAQVAVAIAILTVAPVRLGNLGCIELEENLIRPAGPLSPYWLVFPDYDVKNRVRLEFNLADRVTKLIEEYVHDHRPALLRGSNSRYLFPGETGGYKGLKTLGEQITAAVEGRVGIRVTPHQYRHGAAALIIRETRDYELAKRVLGHKSLATTTKFYLGLESVFATERFGEIIQAHLAPGTLEGGAAW